MSDEKIVIGYQREFRVVKREFSDLQCLTDTLSFYMWDTDSFSSGHL